MTNNGMKYQSTCPICRYRTEFLLGHIKAVHEKELNKLMEAVHKYD